MFKRRTEILHYLALIWPSPISGDIDLDKVTHDEFNSANQIWNDYCLVDPRMQMGSCIYIIDVSGIRKEQFLKMMDQKSSKMGTKYFQVIPFFFNWYAARMYAVLCIDPASPATS